MSNSNKINALVRYVGICGSDTQKFMTNNKMDIVDLGHEAIVTYKNASYVVNPLWGCSKCDSCQLQDEMHCEDMEALGRTTQGAFSGNVNVPASALIPIPNLSPVFTLADPYAVVIHAFSGIPLEDFDQIVIIGDGVIAQLCLIYLLLDRHIVGSCTLITKNESRAQKAEKMYAKGFELRGSEFTAFSIEELKSRNLSSPLIIETVGRAQAKTINIAISLVKPKGTIVSLGVYPPQYYAALDIRQLLYKEARLYGSNSFKTRDFPKSVDQIIQNQNIFEQLLSEPYKETDLLNAFKVATHKTYRDLPKKIIISFDTGRTD